MSDDTLIQYRLKRVEESVVELREQLERQTREALGGLRTTMVSAMIAAAGMIVTILMEAIKR